MNKLTLVVVILATIVAATSAEPAKLTGRFFARQKAEEDASPPNGLYGAPTEKQPQSSGYQYPKPAYGLPEPTTEKPVEAETQSPEYLPPAEEEDLDAPTEEVPEDVETDAVAGGEQNGVEGSQANQLNKSRRLVRPLKLVDGRQQNLQRLIYYPLVNARLQAAQPVLASAAVPIAYVPENGFAYSTQVFHQQNW